MWRQQQAPVEPGLAAPERLDQRVVRIWRLLRQDVQRSARQLAVAQRRLERAQIHQAAACRVDQQGIRLERAKRGRVDHVAVVRSQRAVEADHVGRGEQRLKAVDPSITEAQFRAVGQVRVVEAYVHVQGPRAAARGRADPTHADNAEGAAA